MCDKFEFCSGIIKIIFMYSNNLIILIFIYDILDFVTEFSYLYYHQLFIFFFYLLK